MKVKLAHLITENKDLSSRNIHLENKVKMWEERTKQLVEKYFQTIEKMKDDMQ
jgi:hypothetical protein